jgi:hypothetical protein
MDDLTAMRRVAPRVGQAAQPQPVRMEEIDETARHNGQCPGATQFSGTVQGSKPEERQLQKQPISKSGLQLKQQSELQYEPKPKPTLTPARRWLTVQPCTQSKSTPGGPGPAPLPGSCMAQRCQIYRRD